MRIILLIMIGLSSLAWSGESVVDSSTGLEWQDDYSDNGGDIKYTSWQSAIEYCEVSTLAGHTDWRLPNKKELLSIVDYSRYDPAIKSDFSTTTSDYYWSSTTHANYTYRAWIVFFGDGYTNSLYKDDSYNVRCVRSGQ